MSNLSDLPGSGDGPLISTEELEDAGVEISDEVEFPEVDERAVTLDDHDAGECRWAYPEELRDRYVDNPSEVSSVQHDVWTLRIEDDQEFEFRYPGGQVASIRYGDIDTSGGPGAERYSEWATLVWPTDDHGTVILNATTCPRLAGFKQWTLDELAERSDQRLEIAEIVNAFAGIISMYSGPLDN